MCALCCSVGAFRVNVPAPLRVPTMITSEAEITDPAGAHVVTATSVLLVGAEPSADEGEAA